MEPQRDLAQAATTYAHVVTTFGLGMLRFHSTEAAHARLVSALLAYRSSSARAPTPPEHYRDVFYHLEKIPRSSYDALCYVTDLSLLVYATTLLDTFLLETTTFLLLLFPRALGKTQQISVTTLVSASSTNQIVAEAVSRKAREISFLPFPARVQHLKDTFGLKLALAENDEKALDHFPSVRNAAVHDQGIFEMVLNIDGTITCRTKTCPAHPTAISDRDVEAAVKSYNRVAGVIATAVMSQCLKAPNHPSLEVFQRSEPAKVPPIGDEGA